LSFLKYIFLSLFIFPAFANGQDSLCHAQISLLTVSPGEELYSTFGHSALRVYDSVSNSDIVYNYGTFNFDEPGFYTKFVRGKLIYYLSRDNFDNFIAENRQENRTTTEQILNLDCKEKNLLLIALYANMQEGNRGYKYDFLFDNCTTRLRDLIEKAGADSAVHFGKVLNKPRSFRNLIHEYLNNNDKQWSKLGIDILLGSKTDALMTSYQVMFLPDYLMNTLDRSTIDQRSLVSSHTSLYKIKYFDNSPSNLTHPFFIFCCLFVCICLLSFSKNNFIQQLLNNFDRLLFFLIGLLGILILFMWLGTDHIMCRNNYNLLWAWPINLVAAFYLHSEKKWPRIYFLVQAIFLLFIIGLWFLLPQLLNISLIPIVLIMIVRAFHFYFKKNIHAGN
jgi:hypothetical protein